MKRILYLTLTIMLCLTFFTAVTWAEEKASAASDKILSQQQVDELLQADDNPAAYVKIDEDAYKVYPDFKDKKAVRKELLKNLPTNKVLYLLTASEQTFTLAFDVVKDLEKSGRLYDNSRYMGGKDDSDAGAENIKANIHKFWFMKIPRGSTVYDDGVNVGIGIGIGPATSRRYRYRLVKFIQKRTLPLNLAVHGSHPFSFAISNTNVLPENTFLSCTLL